MTTSEERWRTLERAGMALACLDYGGTGRSAILLHGLAGHAGEWRQTASWLTKRCRVIALDARGHGRSERVPQDVSREAHVADVAFAIEQLELGPSIVIGQSLGGVTALAVAARHPDLARALVLADASPAGTDDPAAAGAIGAEVAAALARWPAPFATRETAVAYFASRYAPLAAEAWADGLEQRDGGWWPAFELDVMERTLATAIADSRWDEWGAIRCPTLVVRTGAGEISADDARRMTEARPGARLVELPGAAHDLHLDQPAAWRDTLSAFLDELG
jgi:pimeloyl-ACP methyl ester carboxylesterase